MSTAAALWVVPPHRDATLLPAVPADAAMCDLQAAFHRRVLSAAALAETAAAWRANLDTAGAEARPAVGDRSAAPARPSVSPRALLELEAARAVLLRAPASGQSRLRAEGIALAALTAAGPLKLRLDDVELAGGATTERSADLRTLAAQEDLPFEPELRTALAEAKHAAALRLVLDCDQRLPFVFAFLQRLGRTSGVTLCGGFASRHRDALTRAWPGVEVGEETLAFELPGTGLWRWDGAPVPPGAPWAGYLSPSELGALPPGCVHAVVQVAAIDGDRLMSLDGQWHPLSLLSTPGTSFSLEWQFGAPGVDLELAERTSVALTGGKLPWCAGLRRFHWAFDRPAGPFGAVVVTLDAPPEDRDLARGRAFRAEGTATEEALHEPVRRTLLQLQASTTPPSPGRVAAGMRHAPVAAAAPGDFLRMASDAAVVELPVSLDGRAQRTVVATNLRSGSMLSLDARLLPLLNRLERTTPAAEVLSGIPAAAREKLLAALKDRNILEGVHP